MFYFTCDRCFFIETQRQRQAHEATQVRERSYKGAITIKIKHNNNNNNKTCNKTFNKT